MHTQSGQMKAMQITQNNTLNVVSLTKLISRAALTGNALTRNAPTRNALTRNAPTRNAPTRNAPTRNAPETIFAIFSQQSTLMNHGQQKYINMLCFIITYLNF
jgi:hypothetical protein